MARRGFVERRMGIGCWVCSVPRITPEGTDLARNIEAYPALLPILLNRLRKPNLFCGLEVLEIVAGPNSDGATVKAAIANTLLDNVPISAP